MEKQSNIVKALQTALDELEVLVLEGENLDLNVMESLMKKFEKLKKAVEAKNNNN